VGESVLVYGVPGPVHVELEPSPHDQVTDTGVAVAVTDSPGTDAVADAAANTLLGNQLHIGTYTSWGWPGAGFVSISGFASFKFFAASAASTAGAGGAAVAVGAAGSHTTVVVVVAILRPASMSSGHVIRYQAPFWPLCASVPVGGWYPGSTWYVHAPLIRVAVDVGTGSEPEPPDPVWSAGSLGDGALPDWFGEPGVETVTVHVSVEASQEVPVPVFANAAWVHETSSTATQAKVRVDRDIMISTSRPSGCRAGSPSRRRRSMRLVPGSSGGRRARRCRGGRPSCTRATNQSGHSR